jgi:hypothetical protein
VTTQLWVAISASSGTWLRMILVVHRMSELESPLGQLLGDLQAVNDSRGLFPFNPLVVDQSRFRATQPNEHHGKPSTTESLQLG